MARAGLRGSRTEELFNGSPVPVGGDVIVAVAGPDKLVLRGSRLQRRVAGSYTSNALVFVS